MDGKYCVGIYSNKNLKEDICFKKNPIKFFKQKPNFYNFIAKSKF